MEEPTNRSQNNNEEIMNQLSKIDSHFDRKEWLFIGVSVIILFLLTYIITILLDVPDANDPLYSSEMHERIVELEQRVESLEERLNELEMSIEQ